MQKISSVYWFVKRYVMRNKYILDDTSRLTVRRCVNLHWWRPTDCDNKMKDNLGDYLANPIFEFMLLKNNIKKNVCKSKKHLYTVGSIIFMGLQDAVIWGSGLLCECESNHPFLVRNNPFNKPIIKLDIRAVRGPRTREVLLKYGYECPEIYGDPAVLMPIIYPGKVVEKEYDYLLIHHMGSDDVGNGLSILTTEYKLFIDEIKKARLVISGSLHGVILAEAYGTPAILLRDRKKMDLFKYQDYYYSTDRYTFPVADTVEEALGMTPPPIPNFEDMQRRLMESFPTDMWN